MGELADLRLKLRASIRATQEALHAGVGEDESLKQSLALFEQLRPRFEVACKPLERVVHPTIIAQSAHRRVAQDVEQGAAERARGVRIGGLR